ncbi:tRNA lysidine(34) synthetase TilS [Oricola sp.]|uniref:tRNA lysidine(34) synthetase TilS n=1 Tax=Oricola sp. TaxID=1979950 RepID=UPI003BAB1893
MLINGPAASPDGRSLPFIDLAGDEPLVAALSGGSDSTALVLLIREALAARDMAQRLVAVTVDHGLRPESAAEAERAATFCAQHDIPHETRVWNQEKPATGLQKAAREARYRLLAEAAAVRGAACVLTGHTFDDQCETIAMRAMRGAGRGASGIAPATLFAQQTWFARPLLAMRRDDLRDWLRQAGECWIDDPSNEDPVFERVRMRRQLAASGVESTAADHRALFEARRAAAQAAAGIVADERTWRFEAGGARALLLPGSPAATQGFALALAAVLAKVGNCAHLPGGQRLEEALRFVGSADNGEGLTVSGCLLVKRAGATAIEPEARNARRAGFAYDTLVPLPDLALADAIGRRCGRPPLPEPPLASYPV